MFANETKSNFFFSGPGPSQSFLHNMRDLLLKPDRPKNHSNSTNTIPNGYADTKRSQEAPVYLLQSNELVTESELYKGLAKIGLEYGRKKTPQMVRPSTVKAYYSAADPYSSREVTKRMIP